MAQDYIEKTDYVTKEEKDKIIQTYKDVNKVGIKSYNYVLLMKALITSCFTFTLFYFCNLK